MRDLRDPRLLCLKGALFVLLGLLASVALILENPSVRVVLLLGLAVWAFARAYYFAFYVIEHYIDGSFKFAGLVSAARYLLRAKPGSRTEQSEHGGPCNSK